MDGFLHADGIVRVPKVVAEIGCAHVGQVQRAKQLINLAVLSGATVAKFQKRNPVECVPRQIQNLPHPNQIFSYGDTYLKHREALELSIEDHRELKYYCEQCGIEYSCSVWDMTSARQIVELKPSFIKVGSPSNTHFEMLSYLLHEYEGNVHVSLGMTTDEERCRLCDFLFSSGVNLSRIVLYHCTSEYPCRFEHLFLREIDLLRSTVPPEVAVGFSNHGYGIAADIAAYMLGAEWIERHFIDDRTFRHTDAAASLEPDGLRRVCRDLKAVYSALSYRDGITDEEQKQRLKLKYRVNEP